MIKTKTATMSNIFFNAFCQSVNEEDKLTLLSDVFLDYESGLHCEQMVFRVAENMSTNYRRGLWEIWDYCEIENPQGEPVYFMHPNKRNEVFEVNSYYGKHFVDAKVFGLVTCMMTYAQASMLYSEKGGTSNLLLAEIYSDLYHTLRTAFFKTVDKLAYVTDSSIADEDIECIKHMSSTVYKILD